MTDTPLLQQLADGIIAKPLSSADRQQAALLALDAVANTLAGRASVPGEKLLRWAKANTPLDTARRAFLWGALTHILETDDLHRASVIHPGCVVVPAAWSVALKKGVRGHAFLQAVLWGVEATTRVGMAVGQAHYRLWHNTATCGPYGAAMASAALLQLSPEQTLHALGNAGAQSSGLWQFLKTGAMTKHLHAGRAAEAGVLSAELAQLGMTGPPQMLEGAQGWFTATCPDADPEAVTRDFDSPWQVHLTAIKPWPSCRHTHPAIDAAQSLHPHFVVDAIAQIDVETYPAALDVCDRPLPQSEYEAKFSLQHCVAAALQYATVDFAAFSETARAEVAALRAKVKVRVAEPYLSAYPQAWGSAVTVTLQSGEQHTVRRDHAKGDPEAPLSRDDVIQKAQCLMQYGGVRDPQRLIAAVLALPENAELPALPVRCGYGHGWQTDV